MAPPAPDTVVFDLGGVLIDWNPRHLYRKMFADEAEMERFLAEATPYAWNHRLDGGASFLQLIAERKREFPHWSEPLDAYWSRWPEMLGPPIEGTVRILEELQAAGVPMFGLTNWSQHTWPFALERYPFLGRLRGVLVSGQVGLLKPEPPIYERFCAMFGVEPAQLFFTDDRPHNVEAAKALGWRGHWFTTPEDLRSALERNGLLPEQ